MKRRDQLEIFDEDALHAFSNLISFNLNAEEVCMGVGIRDVKDSTLVNIHTYVHMTIPHFVRFADAVNEQMNVLMDRGIITREPEQ
jgi:hypothetical protein